MRKSELKRFVYRMTINSLRTRRLRTADLGLQATQKDVVKAEAEMHALAQKLETILNRRRPASEPEAGPSGPDKGKDHLPEDPHPAAKGDEAAAAG